MQPTEESLVFTTPASYLVRNLPLLLVFDGNYLPGEH